MIELAPHRRLARSRLAVLLAAAVAATALALFLIRARVGLVTLEFGDETEKFVAAAMLRHGGRLYLDVFANHGPLAYAVAWLMTFLTGTEDFTLGRLPVVVLALAAALSIITSPALSGEVSGEWQGARIAGRLWAGALFLLPMSAFWFVHPLHMVTYHALGGDLVTIVCAQLVVPAILGAPVRRWNATAAGAAAALAVTASYPFAAAVALLIASAGLSLWADGRARALLVLAACLAAGGAAAALPMAAWISLRADWVGLYAYHFYFNQVVYAAMTGYAPWQALRALVIPFDPAHRAHSFAIVSGLLAMVGVVWLQPHWRPARVLAGVLLAAGLLMLNPKGSHEFPDTAEMIALLGVFALVAGVLLGQASGGRLALALAAVAAFVGSAEGTARTALLSPQGMLRADAPLFFLRPNPDNQLAIEVRRAVPPSETFLALPFAPALYIEAARLPASGQFFYLPFQAEYDKVPTAGRRIDLCRDIERTRPAAIVAFDGKIANFGSVFDYKPCLADVLARDYRVSPAIPSLYLRNMPP